MARPSDPENSSLLSWFFELVTMDRVRVIGLLLSASAFTWTVLTTIAKTVQNYLDKRRNRIPPSS